MVAAAPPSTHNFLGNSSLDNISHNNFRDFHPMEITIFPDNNQRNSDDILNHQLENCDRPSVQGLCGKLSHVLMLK